MQHFPVYKVRRLVFSRKSRLPILNFECKVSDMHMHMHIYESFQVTINDYEEEITYNVSMFS